jgi:phenylacetate-CoA ligase
MQPVPNYFRVTDFEAIYRDHPLPDEYERGMFRWSPERVHAYQERLFSEVLATAWKNPFYSRIWRSAGLQPGDIRGLGDLEKLPIVSSDDFKRAIEANPPFGLHQGVGPADAVRHPLKLQSSGGTTGRPRPTFFGPLEWEVQGIQTARALYVQGARPGDVMLIPVTLTTSNLGWCYFQACYYYMGIVPITTGSGVVTPSRRQIEYAQTWGANILGAFPEYLLVLAKAAEEMGVDPRSLGIKLISTYLGPDTEGHLRDDLEDSWGAPAYDNYGSHEIGLVSFECQAKQGLHFSEDTIFVQVTDIESGAVLPRGETGNLVATSLHRRYPPLIRYNMLDLVRLLPARRCECGSESLRMDHFLGRSDDMVKLRGTNVFPMACLNAVQSDRRTTGQWLCVVDHVGEGRSARDEMTIRVESVSSDVAADSLRPDLEKHLREDLGVRVTVEVVPAGSLADLTNHGREGKVRRLLDRRPGYKRLY